MSTAIGTYVSLLTRTGANPPNPLNFQNFHNGEARTYDGVDYLFGSFGFSGGTVDVDAANIEASLVFQVNDVNLTFAQTSSDDLYIARVRTVWLDPDTLDEDPTLRMEEIYAITGFEHDNSRLTLRLGSPLDAVTANTPRRVLTQEMVGALPSSANISFI